MAAVPDFGRALLGEIGAPRGHISTFAEIPLKDANGRVSIPDGAIVVERGKARWACLVEVKTSGAELKPEQVSRYLDMARAHGFSAVLTLSNQITATPHETPVAIDKRKAKDRLFHLSWWRVITEAIVQHRFRGIDDPDQAWILSELIAYLDHERSGASGFQDMGDKWVDVRNAVGHGTLRAGDTAVRDVAERWNEFVDYLCLGLSQDLGRNVKPVRPRKKDGPARIDDAVRELADSGVLRGTIRVPDAAGPVTVLADLRTRKVSTSVRLDAPQDRRPSARISWLLRQLKDAASELRIDVGFAGVRETTSLLLGEAREYPQRLLSATDPKREPRSFELTLTKPLATKRGKGERSFVLETRKQSVGFYRDIVQGLKPWQPPPPKLPDGDTADSAKTSDPSPGFSTTDHDPGESQRSD